MAKVITDIELVEIISNVLNSACAPGSLIADEKKYSEFLLDTGKLLTKYFGGEVCVPSFDPNDGLGWTVIIQPDDNVPDDGGVWEGYDTDVSWVRVRS
jgi:hypothetical protein